MGHHDFLEQLVDCGWDEAEIEIVVVVEHIVLVVYRVEDLPFKQQACTHYSQEIPCFSP
ncbi:MAG TPA: hypothetical protein PLU47_05200 [Azonexus sp.]|nr:hypothetical protein [Azonexus sp.]